MHCEERHHTEGAKGPGEDKPKSTKAQSLPRDITIVPTWVLVHPRLSGCCMDQQVKLCCKRATEHPRRCCGKL